MIVTNSSYKHKNIYKDTNKNYESIYCERNKKQKILSDSTNNIKLCVFLSNINNNKIIVPCHGLKIDKNERNSFDTFIKIFVHVFSNDIVLYKLSVNVLKLCKNSKLALIKNRKYMLLV